MASSREAFLSGSSGSSPHFKDAVSMLVVWVGEESTDIRLYEWLVVGVCGWMDGGGI